MKKQFSILIADTEYKLRDKDLNGWVVQIPEDDSVSICPERIINVAYEFNTAPKSPRMPVKTIAEAREAVTAKLFKEQNIWIKTKVPILLMTTANKIPMAKVK